MKLTVKYSSRFAKDLKLAQKQNKNLDKLFNVIEKLANLEKSIEIILYMVNIKDYGNVI